MSELHIFGGTVIDGLGRDPYAADVLVSNDRITAIGSGLEVPGSAERLDATGKTVMPGLIDSHCHISFDEPNSNDELFFHRREGLAAIVAAANAQKLLRAGVTSIMDADSLFEIGVDLRDAIEAGITPGPRMAVGGNALFTSVGGTAGRLVPDAGVIGYGRVLNSKDEIVSEVRRQIKRGVDWIKVHVTGLVPRQRARGELKVWTLEELRLVTSTAHELGIPVVGHCRGADSVRDAALAGFDLILHATYMDDEALDAVLAASVPIVPTLTFQANLLQYGAAVRASANLQELFRLEIADSVVMLRKAFDAGVPLLCGSESGFSITPYGEWHHKEMDVFVQEIGLTPLQAIKAATSDNAVALRMPHDIGAIEEGRLADILVVDGDPSVDVNVLGDRDRLQHIILGGKQVILPEPPPRQDPPGWRVSHYGDAILTQSVAGGDA